MVFRQFIFFYYAEILLYHCYTKIFDSRRIGTIEKLNKASDRQKVPSERLSEISFEVSEVLPASNCLTDIFIRQISRRTFFKEQSRTYIEPTAMAYPNVVAQKHFQRH